MTGDAGHASRYRHNPEVIERRLGEQVVVLLPSGDVTVLDGGAAAVWMAVGTGCLDVAEICSRVFAGPSGTEELALVRDMVEVLVGHGALLIR